MTEKKMLIIMGIIATFSCLLFGWIGLIPLCGFLFALGGYKQKLWRRLGIAIVALISIIFGYPNLALWRYIVTPLLYFGVLSLPYGENHDTKQRIITGASYGAVSTIFLYSDWLVIITNIVITCLGFQLIWYLSNKKGLTWKIAEWILGAIIGVTLIWKRKKDIHH